MSPEHPEWQKVQKCFKKKKKVAKTKNTMMGIWAAHSDFLPKRDSIETERKKYLQGKETWDFPGGSVVRTLCFHCRGPLRGSGNARGVQCGQKKKKSDK